MNHVTELFLWFFSQRGVMMLVLIPFGSIVVIGSIMMTVRR